MKKIIYLIPAFLIYLEIGAQKQNFWTPVSESDVGKNLFAGRDKPDAYRLFQLQESSFNLELLNAPSEKNVAVNNSSLIITLPNAEGQPEQYRVVEAPIMDPLLSAKYPDIRSYSGLCIEDPSISIRFSVSVIGFHGMVLSSRRPTIYISPLDVNGSYYMVASRKDMSNFKKDFECLTNDIAREMPLINEGNVYDKNADDAKLRTFKLALAASGEFSQFWLDGSEANDADRRAKVLAAQNMLMTRCNGIFEKDFGVRLILVANNDAIIYLDASTDPWPGSGYNSQTQTTIDAVIMNANYDIGHLVDRNGNNGNAGCIGCLCVGGMKGSGFTSLSGSNWSNDLFVIDYLPHEIGHQMGGNHTFSHDDEGPTIAQVEPGSGTTIMGYAGITGPTTDVADHSHDNFHAISIKQITDHIKAAACAVVSNTGNNIPTANAGSDFTIPKSTPFILTGSGTDADAGDVLNYVWEQMDVASSFGGQPSTTATNGPVFRCFSPTAGTSRTFPSLASILDGTNGNTWERLPSVARTLNFRFTIRDNHPGAGNNKSDDMVVTVSGTEGPFAVTSPNTAVTWCPGPQTVTWSVNGSDALAANIKISLSYDGGLTFPVTLAASTPNDGSESVNIPCTKNTTTRIKVEAVGNVFFDISDANFTVGDNTPPTFTDPADITIYKDNNCNHNASVAATGDVTDEDDNCDNSLNATFVDAVVPGSCIGNEIITRTWSLTDDCGNPTIKNQVITVQDTTRPVISGISANPAVLWPPNHKMRLVTISYNVQDNCSPAAAITSSLSVVSNEPINGTGDGDTAPDWVVVDKNKVWLRAERAGNGSGRIYTVTITSTDDCGNVATGKVTVSVPHNGPVTLNNLGNVNTDNYKGLSLQALPNPSSKNFTILVKSDNTKERLLVKVFDIYGRKIEDKNIASVASLTIGDNYRSGVYIIRVAQGDRIKELKLIKISE